MAPPNNHLGCPVEVAAEVALEATASLKNGEPASQQQPQQQYQQNGQQMDDCMAAMVLMFLSCKPGECQLNEDTLRELQELKRGSGSGPLKLGEELKKLQELQRQQQQMELASKG